MGLDLIIILTQAISKSDCCFLQTNLTYFVDCRPLADRIAESIFLYFSWNIIKILTCSSWSKKLSVVAVAVGTKVVAEILGILAPELLGIIVLELLGIPGLKLLGIIVLELLGIPGLKLLGIIVLELLGIPGLELLGIPGLELLGIPVLDLLGISVLELSIVLAWRFLICLLETIRRRDPRNNTENADFIVNFLWMQCSTMNKPQNGKYLYALF